MLPILSIILPLRVIPVLSTVSPLRMRPMFSITSPSVYHLNRAPQCLS